MELSIIDQYFEKQPAQNQAVLLFLRQYLLELSDEMTEHWKYGTPFYYYKSKPFCYFHHSKKTGHPYMGLVRAKELVHPSVERGNRKKMQIFEVDPTKDLPLDDLQEVMSFLIEQY